MHSIKNALIAATLLLAAPAFAGDGLPPHPRDIQYPAFQFTPPKVADHRVLLSNGIVCYLVPDRLIPALRVEVRIKAGELHVPKDRRGLAKLTGTLLRDGGAGERDSKAFDLALDKIAAEMSCSFEKDHGEATLWTLSSHRDEALGLLVDALRRPRFDEDRVRRARNDLKEDVAHRDDDPQSVLGRKYAEAIYGDGPAAWVETAQTVDAIDRGLIVHFWKQAVRPETLIISVAGDFDRAEMQKKLEALFGDWKGEPGLLVKAIPAEIPKPHGALVVVDKEVNQGYVQMGHLTVPQDSPDLFPLEVMDYILGDGSFTSRVTSRVRNDEGLAYSAGSFFSPRSLYPGTIGLYFQSKVETVAYASKICLDEARRMRDEPVSAVELGKAKDTLLNSFPSRFATAHATASTLAENELLGRPADWLDHYRERIAAVKVEDVQRVARAHLRPEDLAIVIVGPEAAVRAKDAKHGVAVGDLVPK